MLLLQKLPVDHYFYLDLYNNNNNNNNNNNDYYNN